MILKTFGNGNRNIVLLHGWGANSNIWNDIIKQLSSYFRLYTLDLPGYYDNENIEIFLLKEIAEEIVSCVEVDAIWLGWSLGGLIIIQIAKDYPNLVRGLVTVSSSPCFTEKKNWPGIKKLFFLNFIKNLKNDPIKTINKFLILQTLNTKFYRRDLVFLKKIIFSRKIPNLKILLNGLEILYKCDLRSILSQLSIPILHVYGNLDSLIPKTVISFIEKICINSTTILFKNAAHVPFLNNSEIFCKILCNFDRIIRDNKFLNGNKRKINL